MNTTTKMSTLPYLPTELWDKIYDIKESMEERDAHRDAHKNAMYESLLVIMTLDDYTCSSCEERCWEVDKSSGHDQSEMIGGICPDCIERHWEYYQDNYDGHDAYEQFLDDVTYGTL